MSKITEQAILEFYREHLQSAGQITLRQAAGMLNVSHMTVRDHVANLCHKGLMVRRGHKLYVTVGGMLLDQRGAVSDETSAKKAEGGRKGAKASQFGFAANKRIASDAGKAGAVALKRLAEEKGVPRFTPGMGKDEATIKKNIEKIVRRAEENGTLYHPRPVYVVLVGEKVG